MLGLAQSFPLLPNEMQISCKRLVNLRSLAPHRSVAAHRLL